MYFCKVKLRVRGMDSKLFKYFFADIYYLLANNYQ